MEQPSSPSCVELATHQYVVHSWNFGLKLLWSWREGSAHLHLNTCAQSTCDDSDAYAGYTGALKCAAESSQDAVAFIKQSTFDDYQAASPSMDPPITKVWSWGNHWFNCFLMHPLMKREKVSLSFCVSAWCYQKLSLPIQLTGVLPLQNEWSLVCDDGCLPMFNDDGSTAFATTNGTPNYQLPKCTTGKNAANAMVSLKAFVGTQDYTNLLAAMGLASQTEAPLTNDALKDESSTGLFGSGINKLYKLSNPSTDAGFKSFFQTYEGFRDLQALDVSFFLHDWTAFCHSCFC